VRQASRAGAAARLRERTTDAPRCSTDAPPPPPPPPPLASNVRRAKGAEPARRRPAPADAAASSATALRWPDDRRTNENETNERNEQGSESHKHTQTQRIIASSHHRTSMRETDRHLLRWRSSFFQASGRPVIASSELVFGLWFSRSNEQNDDDDDDAHDTRIRERVGDGWRRERVCLHISFHFFSRFF
jgi:hypothetical protein